MFESCTDLESVTIPSSVRTIRESAFYCCMALKKLTIPEGVTKICASAFSVSGLEEIHLPRSVRKIESWAFFRCPGLTIYAPAGSYAEQFVMENGEMYGIRFAAE